MRYWFFFLILILTSAALFGLSHGWKSAQNYDVDKTSPNGAYRVKIEFREEKAKGLRDYTERLRMQFLKGQEVIETHEFELSDQWEPSMRDGLRVVEWVNDNVLHWGEDRSERPFRDELIISNNTDEYLKKMMVSYGRAENFAVFDLAPGSQITLLASPGFAPNHSSRYFLGYGGRTQSGKKFEGVMEKKQRSSPADGPFRFQIMISAKDLR